MATKGNTVTPSGGGLGDLNNILGGLAGAGGTSGQPSLSGSAGANLNTQVYVPTIPGTTIGMHWATIQSYINGLSPADLMSWEPLLVGTGYASTTDPTALRSALANALYDGSQTPNAFDSKGVDPTTYLNGIYNAQQNAAPAGPARAYRGGVASISVTPAQTVQVVGDAVAQQLLGRHIHADEVDAITAMLNGQEYAKGAADIATAQASQEAMNVAFGGGVNATNAATMPTGLNGFMAAIKQHESGGDYSAVNKDSGAFGAYQIMPSNWSSWAKAAGLPANAPETQQNQDIVAAHQMTQLYNDLGQNWGAVAVAWYAGEGTAKAWLQNPNAPQFTAQQSGGYPSINSYVQSVMGAASGGGSTPGAVTQNSVPSLQPLGPGQTTASETIGGTEAVKRGNETYYQLPPTATIYQTPETTDQAAATYFQDVHPREYQTENLTNVFGVIQKMLGGAPSSSAQGPISGPVNMP